MVQVSGLYLLVCLKLHTSQGCFCRQTFFIGIPNWTCCHGTPLYLVCNTNGYYLQGCSQFVTDCPCGVWCHWLTTCPCILVHYLTKLLLFQLLLFLLLLFLLLLFQLLPFLLLWLLLFRLLLWLLLRLLLFLAPRTWWRRLFISSIPTNHVMLRCIMTPCEIMTTKFTRQRSFRFTHFFKNTCSWWSIKTMPALATSTYSFT